MGWVVRYYSADFRYPLVTWMCDLEECWKAVRLQCRTCCSEQPVQALCCELLALVLLYNAGGRVHATKASIGIDVPEPAFHW